MSECESITILRLPITHSVSEKGKEMPDAAEWIERSERSTGYAGDFSARVESHVLDTLPLTRSVVLPSMERLLLAIFLPHFRRCFLLTVLPPSHV